MRIINCNLGYFEDFDCSIHGKIIATQEEWNKAIKYLFNNKVKHCYLHKDILREDLERKIKTINGYMVNIRVGATELIVNKFGVDKYRKGNYIFEIIK